MFHVFNVQQWLSEVVSACNENSLDPEDSVFVLLIFSSLDFDFVTFFRDRKPQISAYSGESVHIFTPMIFDNAVVPDNEWRLIRNDFFEAGIPLGTNPAAILFRLRKRSEATGFDPHYFAAFELPTFDRFERVLRDFIEACIRYRGDESRLTRGLGTLLGARNLVRDTPNETLLSREPITEVLHAPKVFISYSHADKQTVLDLYHQLEGNGPSFWLDQLDLIPGMLLQQKIKDALRASDAMLAVLSRNSINSEWIRFEEAFFHGQNDTRPIIPVILDDEGKSLAKQLPSLDGRLYVDLSNAEARQENIAKLSSALMNL